MILSVDAKNAMLVGLADSLNTGTNALFSVWIDSTLAVELAMPNPVQLSIDSGVLTFNTPPEALAIASGTPTRATLSTSSGVLLAEFDVATEVTLDKDKIYEGGYVGVQSLVINI